MEIDTIYNMDCLEGMKQIPDGTIDAVICDLPYGVLNGESEGGSWDTIIPFEPLWAEYRRVCKPTAAIVLFAQGMFTADLMHSNPKMWRYNLIWKKGDRASGFLNANRMPLRNHEDIVIFYDKLPTYNPQMRTGFPNHTRGHGGGKLKNGCYGKFDPWARSEVITTEKFPLSIIDIAKEHDVNKQFHPTQKPVDLVALPRSHLHQRGRHGAGQLYGQRHNRHRLHQGKATFHRLRAEQRILRQGLQAHRHGTATTHIILII